ncbi:hypothetical protein HNY73_010442 [Argiope bruennichi]|uniref:Uncharacterized protein n=1 Tax=Argiope bruennichi TaxID=94029 RepID=A0A8T0F1W3_ARGBR|nr:hypothetical protein HNY73_010442 [Argiope bruennichi]
MIQPMHFQATLWLKDHDFLPHRKGFSFNYRKMLCWSPDGSIDREGTAMKYVKMQEFDTRDRFIMACNYGFEEAILHLWDVVKIVGINCTARRGVNSAVRLWMDLLRNGCTSPSNEKAEAHFAIENLKPTDIPLRLSTYFKYLSPALRQEYFKPLGRHHLHEDDFRMCLPQMGEAERDRLFKAQPIDALGHYLEHPFEFRFIKMAKKLSPDMVLNDYIIILDVMLKLFMLCGDLYSDLMKAYWAKIPALMKRRIKRTRHFKVYNRVFKHKQNRLRNLQEIIGVYHFSYIK